MSSRGHGLVPGDSLIQYSSSQLKVVVAMKLVETGTSAQRTSIRHLLTITG